MKEFNPNNQNTMVSFEVVSLFTNVPLVETFDIILNRLYDCSEDLCFVLADFVT